MRLAPVNAVSRVFEPEVGRLENRHEQVAKGCFATVQARHANLRERRSWQRHSRRRVAEASDATVSGLVTTLAADAPEALRGGPPGQPSSATALTSWM